MMTLPRFPTTQRKGPKEREEVIEWAKTQKKLVEYDLSRGEKGKNMRVEEGGFWRGGKKGTFGRGGILRGCGMEIAKREGGGGERKKN